jgi:hypothetical protein
MATVPDLSVTEAQNLRAVTKIKGGLRALVGHLRDDVKGVEDPRARALFETAAETLGGLLRAFEDYERGTAPAWREGGDAA